MNYRELRAGLPMPPLRVDDLYADFQRATGQDAPETFLGWLRDHGHLTQAEWVEAQASRPVEVSPLATLQLSDLNGDTYDFDLPEDSIEELPPEDLPPEYEELGPLGEGAMGEVVLVLERTLGRRVALKRLHRRVRRNTEVVGRFYREAQITAQLDHPGIVPVYSLSTQGGEVSYTMKVVHGDEMKDLIRACRERVDQGKPLTEGFSLQHRIRLLLKACDAVHFAHERGFIHRDLKPANIMIGPFGEVYVLDWGIARAIDGPEDSLAQAEELAEGDASLFVDDTRMGVVLGTPRYMAPEQANGDHEHIGPASDQYALGLVLQELVTLERARGGKTAETVLGRAQVGARMAALPYQGHMPMPRELEAILDVACAAEPGDRYPSVAAFAEDLQRYLDGDEVRAAPDSPIQALERWLAKHRQTTLLIGVGLLTALFAVTTGMLAWQQSQAKAAQAREEALSDTLGVVGEAAHQVYEELLVYEGLVYGLATAAAQALESAEPAEFRVYTAAELAAGVTPDDWQDAPRYGRPVSLEYPVFLPLSDAGAALIPRLSVMRNTLAQAAHASAPDITPEQARTQGLPLVYAFVGFQDGLHMSWPGKAGYPPDYDPRQRPWYTATVDTTGPHWQAPYTDALGLGTVIPCTMSVRGPDGELLGVAGVEMTFDQAADELLALPLEGVESVWLLDGEQRVVLSEPPVEALSEFPYQGGGTGIRDLGDRVLFTFRLGEGFTYAAVLDEATLVR